MNRDDYLIKMMTRNTQNVSDALAVAQKRVEDNEIMIVSQDAKIATLSMEVASLTQAVIMLKVSSMGSGPTV